MFRSFLGRFREFMWNTPQSMKYLDSELFRNHLLSSAQYSNPLRLEKYGYKVYSQNDEDGIIAEIFQRIGTTNKTFVEFGVGDGLENNSHYLLLKGWNDLWIEGSKNACNNIKEKFSSIIGNEMKLNILNSFITKENINDLILSGGVSGEIDLLSIDIDGNDYHIFDVMSVVNPRVVIIEYNAKFPGDFSWIMPYDPNHIWDGSDKQGASLKALELLGRKKGYQLVGTNISGVNAFFVRDDLAGEKFPLPATSETLYNPFRAAMGMCFVSGHPARHYLGQKPNTK